jgi:hypothetical protein
VSCDISYQGSATIGVYKTTFFRLRGSRKGVLDNRQEFVIVHRF